MENKNNDSLRFILAIALSVVVMYGYLYFFGQRDVNSSIDVSTNQLHVSNNNNNQSSETKNNENKLNEVRTINTVKSVPREEKFIYLTNEKISVKFSTKNGRIISAILNLGDINPYYKDRKIDLEPNLDEMYSSGRLNFKNSIQNLNQDIFYQIEKQTTERIKLVALFNYKGDEIRISKSWKLEGYKVWLKVLLESKIGSSGQFFVINGSSLGHDEKIEKSDIYDHTVLSYTENGEFEYGILGGGFSVFGSKNGEGYKKITKGVDWVSIDNRFFMRALKGGKKYPAEFLKKFDKTGTNLYSISSLKVDYDLDVGEKQGFLFSFHYYPKSRQLLNQIFADSGDQFYLIYNQWNWMRVITDSVYWLLMQIYKLVQHFGISIILLTILVKLFTFPLTQKSMNSMQKMSELSPKIKKIRENNKKKPQQANIEVMALYRKEKINPALGCLPMLVPIPIFIAFYRLFPNMFELNNASLFWIENLSQPDKFFTFKTSLPLIGSQFNLLPILMAISQFFQSLLTPKQTSMSEVAETQQKLMKYFFPLMFLFICWNLPSALVLFWFVNNILSIIQTASTRKNQIKKK